MSTQDIVLVSVPYSTNSAPPLGISVLNGVLKFHGYKSKCVDLSMNLAKACSSANKNFEEIQLSLVSASNVDFSFVSPFLETQVKKILELKPKYIGISVFSFMAHFPTVCFAKEIRKQNPEVKIIVGGPGVGTLLVTELHQSLNAVGMEKMLKYGDFLKKRNLIDYVVYGDGEEALLELLNSEGLSYSDEYKTYNYKQEFPFSNFDDYNFYDYSGNLRKGYPQIPVFTSKGCVRNCDFCDVNVIQQRFRFRQGKSVLKELLYLADRYGIRDFNFTDSLVNGSLKSMMEWVTELAAYNNQNPDKKITWAGSWICRPIGQIKEPVYKLLAESGCQALAVGAESGSNSVLEAMDKKTNVEALFYESDQFRKNNIGFLTLLIVGHHAEHWSDFLDTLKMLYRLANYARTGHYVAVSIGATLAVGRNTPMDRDRSNNKIESVSSVSWWTELNPSLTAKERYFRLLLIEKFCQEFNLPLMERVLPYTINMLTKEFEEMKNFYSEKTKNIVKEKQFAEFYFENFDLLVTEIEKCFSPVLPVNLQIESYSVNSDPILEIYCNNTLLGTHILTEGLHDIKFDLSQSETTNLSFRLTNKNDMDTIVDENHNIIKDKFLIFKKIEIDGADLIDDPNFYYANLNYVEDGQLVPPRIGLWKNYSELQLNYSGTFKYWYNKNSKKNSTLAADIITENTVSTEISDDYYRKQLLDLLKQFEY